MEASNLPVLICFLWVSGGNGAGSADESCAVERAETIRTTIALSLE